MEDLPLDISLNILKQLPITSLLFFKLVSKACCYALATNALLTPDYKHYQETPNCLIIEPIDGYHKYPIYLMDNGEVVRRIERPIEATREI